MKLIKKISKINLSTFLFFVISSISVSFAWFAFSSKASSDVSLDVSAWHVSVGENDESTAVVDIDNFYPGMDNYSKSISIINDGDLDAQIEYKIKSIRIFDEVITPYDNIFDSLSHDYPFYFNFSLSDEVISSLDEGYMFINIGWPFEGVDNSLDTMWGNKAYLFKKSEEEKLNSDASYSARSDIELSLEIVVSQSVSEDYDIGKSVFYDASSSKICTDNTLTCDEYFSIYEDSESIVALSFDDGSTPVLLDDIIKIISTDIYDSYIYLSGYSERILGVYSSNYMTSLYNTLNNNGRIYFSNSKFNYLVSDSCYLVKGMNNYYMVLKDGDKSFISLYDNRICNNTNKLTIYKK